MSILSLNASLQNQNINFFKNKNNLTDLKNVVVMIARKQDIFGLLITSVEPQRAQNRFYP